MAQNTTSPDQKFESDDSEEDKLESSEITTPKKENFDDFDIESPVDT